MNTFWRNPMTCTLTGPLKAKMPPNDGTLKFCSTMIFLGISSSQPSLDSRTLELQNCRTFGGLIGHELEGGWIEADAAIRTFFVEQIGRQMIDRDKTGRSFWMFIILKAMRYLHSFLMCNDAYELQPFMFKKNTLQIAFCYQRQKQRWFGYIPRFLLIWVHIETGPRLSQMPVSHTDHTWNWTDLFDR